MTRTIDIKEATQPLSEYAQNADEETVVITSRGRAIAAVVPLEGVDVETIKLGQNPDFMAIIERSRERYRREGGVSSEDVKRRFGIS